MKEKYTQKLRKRVLKRDNYKSQLRKYSEEHGWQRDGGYCERPDDCRHLQVHHIKPQRMGGGSEMQNMITLAECQHVGRCPSCLIKPEYASKRGKPGKWVDNKHFIVHPDMQNALMNYHPQRGLKEVFKLRDRMSRMREEYWNYEHDIEMMQTAIQRTQEIENIRRMNGK